MKKQVTTFALISLLAAVSVRADVVFQDLFQYTNGPSTVVSTNVVGGVLITNWILHSGNPDSFVRSNELEVSTSTAFLGVTSTRTGDVHRQLSNTNNSVYTNTVQPFYASFIMTFTNPPLPFGTYFAHFDNAVHTFNFQGRVQALGTNSLPNCFHVGVTFAAGTATFGTANVFPLDLALNTPYQVVLLMDPTANKIANLWVNPISSSDLNAVSTDTPTYNLNDPTNRVTGFAFRQASGFGGFVQVSNLVVATTFDEAAQTVAPTNAVAPTIAVQPAAVTSNFTGSAFFVFAVANGQGLGSMAYKWQVSSSPANTSPVDVTGGDFSGTSSNVLSIANAHTSDSGYYTLVATTPFGLSVTSSVGKIAITAAPVPPTFTSQPVSQTVYRGQSVTLSASVSSPGNVAWTWYSNNVVVNAGQQDNGDSSTYTLNNVTTNFSATYKVAVTNDVVVNGIVSTNAVLTVLDPPKVTISYLRHLLDPVTYQPTNSTDPATAIPYEVVGTVTTYTNITSGSTSSYYLQDATAGINIFVTQSTGATLFRPQQGDVVDFVGIISSFNTGLELYADIQSPPTYPQTSFVDTGMTAPLPAPIVIPYTAVINDASNANYNLGGSLVEITDVHFGARAGTMTSTNVNDVVSVTNSSGQSFSLLFPALDMDVAGQTLPSFAYKVSGVLFSSNSVVTSEILVTRWSDVVTTLPSPIPLNLSYSGGTLTFTWADPSFSLQSGPSVTGPFTTIVGASSGFMTNTAAGPTQFYRLFNSDP